jgi:ATP synthase protein I
MSKKEKNRFRLKNNLDWAEGLTVVMQLGLTMAGCIGFCLAIGIYLDKWLGIKGVFTAVFIILGIIGGGITVYRQIMEMMKDQKEKHK